MKARCVEFSSTRAVVRLEPHWLARIFGARTTEIELGRVRKPGETPGTSRFTQWVCPGSGRDLDDLWQATLIREALDFREVGDVPQARAVET